MKSSDVPQANSLDRIRQFVEAVRQGATQKKQLQAVTGLSARHADYYGQAARALGWLERDDEVYRLIDLGARMLATRPGSIDELRLFRESVAQCAVVAELAPDLLTAEEPGEDALTSRIAALTDLAPKTARRRAQALLTWRKRIVGESGVLPPSGDTIPLPLPTETMRQHELLSALRAQARLEQLGVERFKRFVSASLDLRSLTVITGPHGSGKSTVGDVIRVLHAIGRGYSLAEMLGERWAPEGTLEWSGIRGGMREVVSHAEQSFGLHVRLRLPDGHQSRMVQYSIDVQMPDAKQLPRVTRERLAIEGHGSFVYDSHPLDDPPLQTPDRLAVRIGRVSRSASLGPTILVDAGRPALSQIAHHPGTRSKTIADIAESVLVALRLIRFLKPVPSRMRGPSFPGQHELSEHGDNLSSVLHAIASDDGRAPALLQALRTFARDPSMQLTFEHDVQGAVMLVLVDGRGYACTARSAADSLLRFLAYAAAALAPDAPPVWVLDDVDEGFTEEAAAQLLQFLQDQAEAQGSQMIVTTRLGATPPALDLATDAPCVLYRLPGGRDGAIVREMSERQDDDEPKPLHDAREPNDDAPDLVHDAREPNDDESDLLHDAREPNDDEELKPKVERLQPSGPPDDDDDEPPF